MADYQGELDRIRAAYRERDAAPVTSPERYCWTSAGYRFYMQELEWAVLRDVERSGARLIGASVLEVGCGSGYFLHRLKEYGAAHACGIDLVEDRIAQARRRYPTLEFVAGDAGSMPWPDHSFDVVTQFTCLSSVLHPAVRARIAAEMWRVLAPGGVIVSYDMRPTPAAIRALHRRARRRSASASSAAVTATVPIDSDELRRLFPDGDLRHRVVSLNTELGALAARSRCMAQLASALTVLRTHVLAVVRKSG